MISGTQLVKYSGMGRKKPQSIRIIAELKHDLHTDLLPLKRVRDRYLFKAEHIYLAELMRQSRDDIGTACKISGISRSQLYALLKKHSLSRH